MHVAITREVSPSIASCELTHVTRQPIDLEAARAQHDSYVDCLRQLGCHVVALPAEPDLPDAVFVEDTAVVLDEVAMLTRPGAASRRREVPSVAQALAPFRPLVHITAPATLDGGDVMRLGRRIFVGLSGRTSREGLEQLASIATPLGYDVVAVAMEGCLHLKSAVTAVAADTLLLNPVWVDRAAFAGLEIVEVDANEPYAANSLLVGGSVIHPSAFPRTREKLVARGLDVRDVDVSELAKAEGAVTCCSLVFDAHPGVKQSL